MRTLILSGKGVLLGGKGSMKRKVLVVGAYERDNFGDLLFYQVVSNVLKGHEVIPGSIMYSDMKQTLAEKVLPYSVLLDKYHWDAVWVAGGEVGGVDINTAYGMSLNQKQLGVYNELDGKKRRVVQRAFSGAILPDTAYLPDLRLFPRNAGTKLIINSVGVANIDLMGNKKIAKDSVHVLKNAHALSVRDRKSMEFCRRRKVTATLMPDAVHAISTISYWKNMRLVESAHSRYITFQISQRLISEYDRSKMAKMLARIIKTYRIRILLVAAGTAVHHDSYAEYRRLKILVDRIIGHERVDILHSRLPADIVKSIINSRLWVGTSLHGRIVASAFGVPRISLKNDKVDVYATTWDDQYPSNIDPLALLPAVEKAFAVDHIAAGNHADQLAVMSRQNLMNLRGAVI